MRGIENKELTKRIVKLWLTGRYRSYSALARVMHTYPKMVQRVVKRRYDGNGEKPSQ